MIAQKAKTIQSKVSNLQRKLYLAAKSNKGRKFYALYDKIYRRDFLWEAWKKVKANKGCPGINDRTIEQIEYIGVEKFLKAIAKELKEKRYRTGLVKRVYINKPDGGKRPLGIPRVKDRVVQAVTKLVIEPIFEVDFLDCSYGYRPKRGAKEALQEVYKYLNFGYTTVIDLDLKSFFDTIPHKLMMKQVARRVIDRKILKLIKMWLKAGIIDGEDRIENDVGTPQGGVISPLLANIYLHQLDELWQAKDYAVRERKDQAHLIRYADDCVILCPSRKIAEEVYSQVKQFIESIGLKINEEKTQIIEARKGFNFLGLHFVRRWIKRYGKEKTYRFPTGKSQLRIRKRLRAVTKLNAPVEPKEIIKKVNERLRGWSNYYLYSNSGRVFNKIQNFINQRIRRFLCYRRKKYKGGYEEYPDNYLYDILGLYKIAGRISYYGRVA